MHVPAISSPRGFVPFDRRDLDSSIPARFSAIVARTPEAIAVRARDATLTYGELRVSVSRVARAIAAALGPAPMPVAVLMEQGSDLLVALLGVLESGHFYVPLDTTHPEQALAGVIADCGAGMVLTDPAWRALANRLSSHVMDITQFPESRGHAPLREPRPDDLAYVYYTSGTTGRPKGVADTHRNVLHNVMRYTNGLFISASDRLTLLQAPAFSGAVSSMFGALLNGATSCPYDAGRDGVAGIAQWLYGEGITIYHSVPSLFRHAMRSALPGQVYPALRVVRLEGDRATPQDIEIFRAHAPRDAVLSHGLGATECGLVSRFVLRRDTPFMGTAVPIGYPVEDMSVRVEDAAGQEVPHGTIGEIVVESHYLSPGYFRRDDATARVFGPGRSPGTRAYRTGDLGRASADGCLEHLGRKDFQPRLRGQRVDAEGVEAAIVGTGLASEAVVDVRPAAGDDARLIAWFVPASHPPPSASLLRRHLSRSLPPHLVPARFVAMVALPLTSHRKLDRTSLPDPDRSRPSLDTPYLAARSAPEQAIAAVWCEALGLDQIGIRDDFFELGGDSLSATLVLERLFEALGVTLATHVFFDAPTLEGLARAVAAAGTFPSTDPEVRSPLVVVQRGGALRPMFFLHTEYGGDGFYCLNVARELGAERPFFALAPVGRGEGAAPCTIETIAAAQLSSIRAAQPHGPYLLGGFCSGAVVAWEMARQLRGVGEQVELLVMIEPPSLRRRKWWRAIHAVAGVVAALRGGGEEVRLALVLSASRRVGRGGRVGGADVLHLSRWLAGSSAAPRSRAPESSDHEWTAELYQRAVSGYLPRSFDVRVLCLRAREELRRTPVECWRTLAGAFEEEIIPGDHDSCIINHANELAAPLRRALEAVSR